MLRHRSLVLLFALGCTADKVAIDDSNGDSVPMAGCEEPVEHPHDETKPTWSYHGEGDGPEDWGTLEGYETCGTGTSQTPIDLDPASALASSEPLVFSNYDAAIPLDLLNNGHTLQVNYDGTRSATDPQVTYDGTTYYLLQLHAHSTSEHTLDGASFPFEVHLVHEAADGGLAVIGVLFAEGEADPTLATLLDYNPGHELEVSCEETLTLSDLVPTSSGFCHYSGSLTTPPCTEGLDWFVLTEQRTASAEQEDAWQEAFEGTTNRPVQDLNGRVVLVYTSGG